MKHLVVDTSVAVKWFFPENGKDKALELKEQHLHKKILLCSRDLLLYEFTSSLKNYSLVRIEEKDFQLARFALESLKMKIFPLVYYELDDLFILSNKLGISVYDCSYVLLAKKLKASLYTADKKLYLASKKAISSFLI